MFHIHELTPDNSEFAVLLPAEKEMFETEYPVFKEKQAEKELQNRMKYDLSAELREDDTLCYRFLKAENFDVDKAEKMLRKHISWRKAYQVDKILRDFKPAEVFLKYVEPNFIGYDKDGDVMMYTACGRVNSTEFLKCIKTNEYMKNLIWFSEKYKAVLRKQAKRIGRMAFTSIILDLDQLELSNATSRSSTDVLLKITHLIQDNCPELIKSFYVINAPAYYVFIYSIIKRVMSSALQQKIHIFGYSGWKEKLLETIDADILPAFLGGKRTDPDGDVFCESFITIPGKISQKFYLTEEERYFKDPSKVKSISLPPSDKREIIVDINKAGSVIHWKIMASYPHYQRTWLGFGLFLQASEQNIIEVLPVHEYDSSDGTVEDSYLCLSNGRYIIVFDNSGGWFFSKDVRYFISVQEPDS